MSKDAHPTPRAARRENASPKAEAPRARVLRAAQSLFSERGFRGTSVRAVAERAGVSVGCVQHHFGTKAELEQAVMARSEAKFHAHQASAFATADTDFEGLVRQGMKNYFEWARKNPELMRLGAWLLLEGQDPRWPKEAQLDAELVRRVVAAQDAGQLRAVEPLFLITVIGILMNGWAVFQAQHGLRLGDGREELDARFVDFTVDLLLQGARPR